MEQLLDVLLKTGKLTKEQADNAIVERQNSNETIENVLTDKMNILKAEEIPTLLEKYYNASFIDLTKLNIEKDILKLVPEEIIRRHKVIPISREEDEISIAMSNPNDLVVIENVQVVTGYNIKPMVALESSILTMLDDFYSSDTMGEVAKEAILSKETAESKKIDIYKVMESKDDAPLVKLVNIIIEEAVRQGASDIHVEPQENNIFVRYRIDGMLHTKELLPKEIQNLITSRLKVMATIDISEKRMPQDGQIRINVQKRDIDLRVSTLPGKYGEKIVIRILDKSSFALNIAHLGLLPETQTKLEGMLNSSNGIVLVTGPTGSGKTTTLYSALNKIKSATKNIITLEDPIEYELLSGKNKECGIAQVQINTKVGLTFAKALRACLRQDPDVILVGEVRDVETCKIAINAALMGHLVLSSLHTNDAVSTITRLLDMGVEPYLISSSIMGVVAQRLVRTLCMNCREKYIPPKRVLEKLNLKPSSSGEEIAFYRPKGCKICGMSGYKGRLGVFELLPISEEIRNLILKREKLSVFRETAKKMGMVSMKENGIQLVGRGITTMAEVLRAVPFEF